MKRATRFKIEFLDRQGDVVWDALVTEYPPSRISDYLTAAGVRMQRTSPKGNPTEYPLYSELDPVASIEAAHEYMARRDTKLGAVLGLLLANRNQWVSRDDIRRVGGDSGDRRVRELRTVGWPIETRQEQTGRAWSCRLVLPSVVPWEMT